MAGWRLSMSRTMPYGISARKNRMCSCQVKVPFEKIAALFNKSPGWARVVFYRAKVQIKEYMEALESEQNIL